MGDGAVGLRVPVGTQARASLGMSGVESGEEWGGAACEGKPGNQERRRGRGQRPK